MINVAIVGVGYWGPNLARNLAISADGRLHTLCDARPERLAQFGNQFPGAKLEGDYDKVLCDPEIDAITIATPVNTHFDLAASALRAGKHVLVEKPLAQTSAECRELISLADERGLTLMVGHVFLYNAAVQRVKEYIRPVSSGRSITSTLNGSTSGSFARMSTRCGTLLHTICRSFAIGSTQRPSG